MTWIQTYTGRKFFPLDPDPGAIDLEDIAHSLSLQCRYNGHCRVFYSVAEHSVRMSRIVPEADRAWALMHDASEAYVSDLPSPLKRTAPHFREAEDRLMRAVATAFALPWPMPESVHEADAILLATEMRDLMRAPADDWQLKAAPLSETLVPVSATDAEAMFLARARELNVRGCP